MYPAWRHMAKVFTLILLMTTTVLSTIVDATNFIEEQNNENINTPIFGETGRYDLVMPDVKPEKAEQYLCTPFRVAYDSKYYIVKYHPNASMDVVHHMLLYGCKKPGLMESWWDCSEMSEGGGHTASPCGPGESQILYAWARNAPELELPDGVGFRVGKGTAVTYLVLQVHYASVASFADGSRDRSGIIIEYTKKPLKKLAGVLLLGTSGVIPGRGITHMESYCKIDEDKKIIPFRFRVHTHNLGKVVSGYHIHRDIYGKDHWTLLGKRNPLEPQMFYETATNETIKMGDALAARCTMESERYRDTYVGMTNKDEMCNFYLMYYVENDTPLKKKYCFTQGPPHYYWKNVGNDINSIPSDASVLLSGN